MSRDDDIFDGIGVEIALPNPGQERPDFLKVRETLTRIGKQKSAEADEHQLEQSCYILHKQGRYVIAHFRELMWMDGDDVEPSESDIAVRNRVAVLLENWGLVEILDDDSALHPIAPAGSLRIIAHRDKDKWQLVSLYDIGGYDRRRVDRVGNGW